MIELLLCFHPGCGSVAADRSHKSHKSHRSHNRSLIVHSSNTKKKCRPFEFHFLGLQFFSGEILFKHSAETTDAELLPQLASHWLAAACPAHQECSRRTWTRRQKWSAGVGRGQLEVDCSNLLHHRWCEQSFSRSRLHPSVRPCVRVAGGRWQVAGRVAAATLEGAGVLKVPLPLGGQMGRSSATPLCLEIFVEPLKWWEK